MTNLNPNDDTNSTGGTDPDADFDTDNKRLDESVSTANSTVLDDLFATIESRKRTQPEGSYTTSLFTHEKGKNAVLEKLGEETTETILAAKDDDTDELVYESADLVYHLLVVLSMHDVDLDDLRAELADRFN